MEPALVGKALLLFLLVAAVLTAADDLSYRLTQNAWQRTVDDILGGLFAGVIFYFYERRRAIRLRNQLQVIDLMNHHIRNALQPLLFVGYQERAAMKLIEKSVDHIDWALREVLTGNSQERFWSGIHSAHPGPVSFFHGWYEAWRKRKHAPVP